MVTNHGTCAYPFRDGRTGVGKGNQAEIKAAVDDWRAEHGFSPPPVEQSRGRLKIREIWIVPTQERGRYLAAVWGWQDVQQVGWVRRRRQRWRHALWTEAWGTVVTSLFPTTPPDEILQLVRQHWVIENRVQYVRDGSYNEDRNHGRQGGPMLAWVRNTAMSLFRWRGFRYIPDGRRWTSAHPEATIRWLL